MEKKFKPARNISQFLMSKNNFLIFVILMVLNVGCTPSKKGEFNLLAIPAINNTGVTSCFDLDNGQKTNESQADICFGSSVGSGVFYTIAPANNASAKTMGTDAINFSDCEQKLNEYTHTNIPEVNQGNHICVFSNQQNLFILTVKEVQRTSDSGAVLTLEYEKQR